MTEQLVDVWERRTEWPLTVAAVLFLGAFAWPILDIHLTAGWRQSCKVVVLAAWVVFVVDYLIRVSLARRWDYWWRHIPDLAILALPALRPLRLLRVVMLLKILNRNAASNLRGRIAAYVVGATGLLLLCSALAVLDAERHHAGANIHNFGDALWWSITTITTVGYGDRFPVSNEGRAVAVAARRGPRRRGIGAGRDPRRSRCAEHADHRAAASGRRTEPRPTRDRRPGCESRSRARLTDPIGSAVPDSKAHRQQRLPRRARIQRTSAIAIPLTRMTVLLILGAPTIVINLRGPESARSRSASEQIDGDARARFYCQSVGSGAKARAGAALGVLEAAYRRQAGGGWAGGPGRGRIR
jgi:voltage-gated potassium channel